MASKQTSYSARDEVCIAPATNRPSPAYEKPEGGKIQTNVPLTLHAKIVTRLTTYLN